jgi:hypothetical protein
MDLLTPDDLAYLAAALLIVLGVLGIAGTTISARSARSTAPFTPEAGTEPEPEPEPIENDHEATHGGNPA